MQVLENLLLDNPMNLISEAFRFVDEEANSLQMNSKP